MKTLPLTNSWKPILIDDEDFEFFRKFNWYLRSGYAATTTADHTKMHQMLGFYKPDHADRNKLNNQKYNLRAATSSQNCANVPKNKITASKYKGIDYVKSKNHWRVRVKSNSTSIYCGTYLTEELAARAYDEYARKYHGEFAVLNFPQ